MSLTQIIIGLHIAAFFLLIFLSVRFWPERIKKRILFRIGCLFLRCSTFFFEKCIFVLDYHGGVNLHFETTEDALREYLPPFLSPIPMHTSKQDETSKYLVSLYTALLHIEGYGNSDSYESNRSDIFTYVRDEEGKTGMYFLTALVDYPENSFVRWAMETLYAFFGMCPYTYTLAYPHEEASHISVAKDHLELDYNTAMIRLNNDESKVLAIDQRLSDAFVVANSQIYRGNHGAKNINFFNESFIDASVTVWDPDTVKVENSTDLHPLCVKLVGAESYEGKDGKPIRWYFENS